LVEASQIVVEHGTMPADDIYHDLRGSSGNDGVTDIAFMLGSAEAAAPVPGSFILHRIGDAISSRDLYSAIYDAYRLCSKL
jgi:hypothetical protein